MVLLRKQIGQKGVIILALILPFFLALCPSRVKAPEPLPVPDHPPEPLPVPVPEPLPVPVPDHPPVPDPAPSLPELLPGFRFSGSQAWGEGFGILDLQFLAK